VKVRYRKNFLTDLARIPSDHRKAIEKFVLEEAPRLNSLSESGRVERMKGHKSSYKVRLDLIVLASD
jgi:mRNA-degrading endonuclease RelE of RelBE toxin-antitoxin system